MKLDRNINPNGKGKYALVKLRSIKPFSLKIQRALQVLEKAGILDYGSTLDTEFFVIRLRDEFAHNALKAYADAAMKKDFEWSTEVMKLATKSIGHPHKKFPD